MMLSQHFIILHNNLPPEVCDESTIRCCLRSNNCTVLFVQLGERSSNGGFTIVAPFAGSPAEEVPLPSPTCNKLLIRCCKQMQICSKGCCLL